MRLRPERDWYSHNMLMWLIADMGDESQAYGRSLGCHECITGNISYGDHECFDIVDKRLRAQLAAHREREGTGS